MLLNGKNDFVPEAERARGALRERHGTPAVTVLDGYAPATRPCLHPPLVYSDVSTRQYECSP